MATKIDSTIAVKIKAAVLTMEPDAEIYVFGSRARGDETIESDWDVLVITRSMLTPQLKRSIRRALYEIEWDAGCVISSIIRNRDDWSSPRTQMTPFYRNVTRESVRL